MARQTIVRLVDDLDETPIENGDGQTVKFGLDGTDYEIDLTNEHAGELRAAVSRYTQAARKVARAGRSASSVKPAKQPEYSTVAVREWAKANKVELSARG